MSDLDLAAFKQLHPPCADHTGGYWICVTHDRTFASQAQKDGHLGGARRAGTRCTLVWQCPMHGPETP